MTTKDHWERIYTSNACDSVGWYQKHAFLSLDLIRQTGLPLSSLLIDVGGGASTLVDDLIGSGFENVTVLDVSGKALNESQKRLGSRSASARWIEADITKAELPENYYDIWHDRAVFHFFMNHDDRAAYVSAACCSVRSGGYLIISAFAEDGPSICSKLPVRRYSHDSMCREFGGAFELIWKENEIHITPKGIAQSFVYCCFRKLNTP